MQRNKKSNQKSKRVAHKTKIEVDLLKPIPLDLIGTKDDPCFGKLFDPRAKECQRCGDAELCAIAMAQRNKLIRGREESKLPFRDLEEDKMEEQKPEVIIKNIKKRTRYIARMAGDKGISLEEVIHDIYASYGTKGFSEKKIEKIITKLCMKSDVLLLENKILKWRKN